MGTGFGSAYYMVENGRQLTASKYGAWYGWPSSGGTATHPYRRAALARSGALQLGRAEGVVFTAAKDDSGEELTNNCNYRIFGGTPDARHGHCVQLRLEIAHQPKKDDIWSATKSIVSTMANLRFWFRQKYSRAIGCQRQKRNCLRLN